MSLGKTGRFSQNAWTQETCGNWFNMKCPHKTHTEVLACWCTNESWNLGWTVSRTEWGERKITIWLNLGKFWGIIGNVGCELNWKHLVDDEFTVISQWFINLTRTWGPQWWCLKSSHQFLRGNQQQRWGKTQIIIQNLYFINVFRFCWLSLLANEKKKNKVPLCCHIEDI